MNMENLKVIDARNWPFTIIDDVIIDDYLPIIKPEGLALYMVLARLAKAGKNSPSQTEIGKMLGWHRETVGRWLKVLTDAGLLDAQRHFENNLETAKIYRLLSVSEKPTATGTNHVGNSDTDTTTTTTVDVVVDAWLKLTGGAVNPLHIDLLDGYREQYTEAWVLDAIQETAASLNATQLPAVSPKYLLSILTRWTREGRNATKPLPAQQDDRSSIKGYTVLR